MPRSEMIVRVKFRSELTADEVFAIAEDRLPEFRALPGLTQKYYVHAPDRQEYGGIYVWESVAALQEYQKSALKASIGRAYRTVGEPEIEVFQVFTTLRE